ncbi:MAG: TetR family transcriptional regulator [Saprospiraceae bacterium]|nr:TetR family transcriptional regulator [Saprospiraceae bacterium]
MESKRNIILHEAALLFREKGYSATTMRDIAFKVGIEAASLYNHISSKQDILKEICFNIAQEYINHYKSISDKNCSNEEKISSLIYLHLRMARQNVAATAVTNREWRHLEEPSFGVFMELRKMYEEGIEEIIKQGIVSNEFIAINAKVALYTILSSLRWVESWYRADREISPDIIEQDVLLFLKNGLLKR